VLRQCKACHYLGMLAPKQKGTLADIVPAAQGAEDYEIRLAFGSGF